MNRNISAAVLAGGRNKRFNGITKANLNVGGKPIISRILNVLDEIFEEILIVANSSDEFQDYLKYKIVSDQIKNIGPLGGIHSALKATTKKAVFVIACDMPFPDKKIIKKVIEGYTCKNCQIAVPRVNNYIEPLHAIYDVSILSELENFISEKKNYAVRSFIAATDACFLDLKATQEVLAALANINNPADLEHLNTWGSE